MKNGYKHKTFLFGNAGESYASSLFQLLKNPNGDRRPDLVSVNGSYNPVLSLEVKSGRQMKGVMVDYQLHYAITTYGAYEELFGEAPPQRFDNTELFSTTPIPMSNRLVPGDPIAYYYCILDRIDHLSAAELDRPYSTIKCRWGDMFMVPSEFAFHAFVASRVMRTRENAPQVIDELKQMMKRDALNWHAQDYANRKGHLYSWQNIQGRDIRALFENDLSFATSKGKDRIQIMSDNYSGLDLLRRVKIDGPNNSSIYVLTNPEDFNLFDSQVRRVVKSRTPILEKISRMRKRSVSLLKGISQFGKQNVFLFPDEGVAAQSFVKQALTHGQTKRLDRIVNWLDIGESKISIRNPF